MSFQTSNENEDKEFDVIVSKRKSPPFPAFKLEEYYEKYEFKTQYMLSCSDPESFSLKEILQIANTEEQSLWDNQSFGYTEVKGSPALREMIAESLYPGLKAENIVCFAGAEDGILCSLLTICTPQDHAIVLTPCYQSLTEIPRFTGCSVTTIELKEENRWRIDIKAIELAIQSNTTLVIMNFPHNPTGQVITREELSSLVELLDKHNIWLFSDEVYRLLGSKEIEWAQPAACVYTKALSLGVMSKTFGMAGLRIGWIACQNLELLQTIARTKLYGSLCNSGPAEIISLIALRNKDYILQRNNSIVASNLLLLDEFFSKNSKKFSWIKPPGGCTGFVKYLGTEDVDTFCHNVNEQAGVLLLPGSMYNIPNHFRIGFGRKNMPEALARLDQFIHR